jgi:hypothetical protein
LRVVDVGDDRAAAEGEQQHHASGHCVSCGVHKVSRSSERECGEAKGRTEAAVEAFDRYQLFRCGMIGFNGGVVHRRTLRPAGEG